MIVFNNVAIMLIIISSLSPKTTRIITSSQSSAVSETRAEAATKIIITHFQQEVTTPLQHTVVGKSIVYFIGMSPPPIISFFSYILSPSIQNVAFLFCVLSNYPPSIVELSYSTCVASCCTYQHWPFQPYHGA